MAEKKFITCDGNYAAAHVAYMFSEVAAIYPITPSSTMAELVDEWAAQGRRNIFGETVKVVEMQSEAGAAGAVHGSLQSGALTSTFTASQGLLLMIPNMYKISGELLPGVFHVSARALAAQSLSIFGDHQDVMATRQTGFAMLATSSVQEVMDLAGVAHLVALKARVPFLHFFDGFRTSHEIQKIELIDEASLTALLDRDALKAFRARALNPEHPVTRGTAQNPDIYFQTREAANKFYDAVPDMVADTMREISKITGRDYKPFVYYGHPEAEHIVVAMGSVTETVKETIDYLSKQGRKVGLVTVHLYRPFSEKYFFDVLPASVKRVCVLDRTKEPGAEGEPLYLDVKSMFYGKKLQPMIVGGRYGLSSKDTTPAQILAVFENLAAEAPKEHFTVGITDDVTNLSLPVGEEISLAKPGTFEALFFGLGADGTVGANKNSIKIIGGSTNKYCQAYFSYDSKKSGGYTSSHLRFGDLPITSPYLVTTPDFVACHVPSYVDKYDVLKGLKPGGSFLLNSVHDPETTCATLPDHMKAYLAKNRINFYVINATKIAAELGLGSRTNTIMQSAFFKIANVIPFEKAVEEMKHAILKSYGKKGEDIVNMNYAAVDAGGSAVVKVEVPAEWAAIEDKGFEHVSNASYPEFVRRIVEPINGLKGDRLPVSAFDGREDGTWDNGTAAYEKRGIAVNVPEWQIANCIQCNQCAYVCPHAVIRPFLATEEEAAASGVEWKQGLGETKEYKFRIQISPLDCTGCGNCVDVCPAKQKALVMRPLEEQLPQQKNWDYITGNIGYKQVVDKTKSVKNLQFAQPLFEFSGACAGCGETPYIKAITQLFGDKMMVANATGCTSIYSGSAPSTPYCTNEKGQGPAWANSLFEDNAEFGLGMHIGIEKLRDRIQETMEAAIASCDKCSEELKGVMREWIGNRGSSARSAEVTARLLPMLEACGCDYCRKILEHKDWLVKKSQWIIGGDGWGYDIGYGGVDHVLASGQDVNILVIDTEVYSNTGGQSSKATPVGAVAKFASSGKRIRKKDLGAMAMTYGYVYVAQVSIGASQQQLFNVLKEAEAYPGPSLVIAYAPCINHGIKGGMTRTQTVGKEAVACGYWHLWHYNPQLEEEGKNPFVLDSKEPDWTKFREFLMKEVRYTSLQKSFPAEADELFAAAEENAKWRYNGYVRRAKMEY
ncbi:MULTISPECIES: pyruvate:ferredoxin (flavodoxin) oxidoreductase [Alistipes]|uniref:Pyruvate-flavodoxin oxidoreductase n=2 Tax=Alistipes TaxID=239759 RepID=A0A4Y1WYT3_9BACT|nr:MULTISPECIES: pyruvate:ferredoxin (flavodoxin) oxidoreductase [Alistipes]MBS5643693.1 pyruvate:ferredoxin (flavodoxin) oxidoreductase [Alistipes sp.]HJC19342.1 pyruvate:ferredoxin (flavodoxin) oxidoreductase [Candidatus Alistipes stercoripullorum]MBQ4903384.1 pyruvate:ferredoxin (flavodoxin) oxidoreductase [Alistipes sp. Marseille-P2263]MCI2259139.1 pyruvate:ferredoxin (flavodoxin) oxidoreductase [Alistipes dispar]BBL05925.1 pyruvate-flavodoxin oxidoreductase [Alistipes dispar]